MTKMKNTKKGMAKKTLSISLAVAMLATSNVPVWAAEFSDGTDAAFTSEAPAEVVEEAPVVEEVAEDVPEAQAADSTYTVDFKDFNQEFQWGESTDVKVKITDSVTGDVKTSDMQFRFIDASGNEVADYGSAQSFGTLDKDGYATVGLKFNKEHVGQTFRMQVFKDLNENWIVTSPDMTVAKKEVSGTVECVDPRYTGSQITGRPEFKTAPTFTGVESGDESEFEYGNIVLKGDDTINSTNFSLKTLKAEFDIVSKYYTGKVVDDNVQIWRKIIKNLDTAVGVELPAYKFEYTGNGIVLESSDITVTDKVTNKVVADAAKRTTIDKAVGIQNVATVIDMKKGTLANFSNASDTDFSDTDGRIYNEVEVTARDLANEANTKISINTVTGDLLQNSTIDADALKNSNLVITDAEGNNLDALKNEVTLDFDGKNTIAVEAGKTYSATIKPVNGNKNLINSRTVQFTVVAHDLSTATFDKENIIKDVTYNGEKQTFGLTAENLTEKLGELRVNDTPLSNVTDYDVNIVFGENTNAGTGTITINGKGGYLGSKKVLTFVINKRTVGNDAVVVPEKVLYNPSIREASAYALDTAVVVKFKENNKDYELTIPASDYTVGYSFKDKNEVGQKIVTTISKNQNKNFVFANGTLTAETLIANKAIAEADVQLEKTEYTYTAKAVVPDYKVVVDGVTLVKDKDYKEQVTNNTDAGEATLTITGMGEYDNTSVSKKFSIVAADISSVKVESVKDKVVYNGKQHLDIEELSITLNGVDVKEQFDFYFPTSKLANINAGDAFVTLVPKKDNKNFVGEKEFTFTISPKALDLNGTIKVFDAKGTNIQLDKATLEYNGTPLTFTSTKYTVDNSVIEKDEKFTADDFEIIYKDNVVGNKDYAAILVVAKGNYAGKEANDYTCADGTIVKNVIQKATFKITKLNINDAKKVDVIVENGAYNEGEDVEPVVTVLYEGKELVKGADYALIYGARDNRKDVTNGKTLSVTIEGKGGYSGRISNKAWGIDKFDFANAEIVVSGTDAEPIVKVINNGKVVKETNYDLVVADGKATVSAKEGSKNYTGKQTVDIKHALEKPETPMLVDVKVVGNKATAVLSGESEGAVGYDYVISTDRDCITNKDYDKVNKNILKTSTDFTYVAQGTYYAYCHAWTRDENGKKVFSDWSNAYPFVVTAITPAQPVITSVKVSGSTVTVTYTKAANAEGYDVVLGSKVATVAGEKRPVEYGTLVKKNIKGNTVTAVFKNVPKGTYYAGLHAFNRTSEDGKKVFSPWSNIKTVKVK